jgi:hypothetical protein
MIRSVIALIATSALAAKVIQHLGQQQRLRRQHERLHHDDVNRWEAEGGNLPVTEPATAAPVSRRSRRR